MAEIQPIILIKKKKHHGGHHGGAWKVAYADFVTAMMALFIVLWLLSSTSKQTQELIAGYFNDPRGTALKKGSEGTPGHKAQDKHLENMDAVKNQILQAIKDAPLLEKLRKQIEVKMTDEGLRVDLIEDKNGTFFELGSAKPTPALQQILKVLSGQFKHLPNRIFIEGHTDAQPYADDAKYDNWELSSDRANEARREMKGDGIGSGQVSEVRGFADQQLRIPDKPFDPANRRVSIVLENPPSNRGAAQAPDLNAGEAKLAKQVGSRADNSEPAAGRSIAELSKVGTASKPAKEESPATSDDLHKRKEAIAVQSALKPMPGFLQRIEVVFGKKAVAP